MKRTIKFIFIIIFLFCFPIIAKAETHTVTFHDTYTDTTTTQNVEDGEKVEQPANPSKPNRVFMYWKNGNAQFDFDTPIYSNITLDTQYGIRWTYDANGGGLNPALPPDYALEPVNVVEEAVIEYNQDLIFEINAVFTAPEGYEFDAPEISGTRVNYGDSYSTIDHPTDNLTFKLLWKKKQYTVTFDTKGGSSIPSQVVDHGDLISTPSNPTKDFRNFKCWQKEGESIFGCYDMTTPVTEELSLYAVYTIDYIIDLNGGTVKVGKSFETELQLIDAVGVFYDADVANMNITAPVMYSENTTTPPKYFVIDLQDIDNIEPPAGYEARYNYTYWDDPAPTYFVKTIGKIIVYSKIQYTVTFDDRGGSQTTAQVVNHGETVEVPTDPHKDHRDFKCWQLDGEPFTECYNFSTPVTEDITLYPVYSMKFYEDIGEATIREGANFPLETDVYEEDPNILLNDNYDSFEDSVIPPENHVYDQSWCTLRYVYNQTVNGVFIPAEPKSGWYPVEWTCYEIWKLKTYTVTFDSKGGTSTPSQTVEHGSTVVIPENPKKYARDFKCWQLDGESYTGCYDFTTPVTEDITLYPVYTMKSTIDLGIATVREGANYPLERDVYVLDDYGNSFQNVNEYDSFEDSVIIPYGYEADWDESYWLVHTVSGYVDENGISYGTDEKEYPDRRSWTLSLKKLNYTLTFDTQNGDSLDSITKKYQETITLPTPTKAGNEFVEWQEKDDQGNVINTYQAGSTYEFTDNKTLYANWNVNTYDVTFHVENEETVQQVNHGSKATRPTDPVKDDYDFKGWYSNSSLDSLYDFDSTVLGNLDLYAGFELSYKTLNGDEELINKGESDDIIIAVLSSKYTFDSVEIDGNVVDPSNYDVDETNNTIAIHKDYLNTLDIGSYNVHITYLDGEVNSSIRVVEVKGEETTPTEEVEENNNPKTSDNIINKIIIFVIGLVGITFTLICRKRIIKE